MRSLLRAVLAVVAICAGVLSVGRVVPAAGASAVLIVDGTADGPPAAGNGQCDLREAIEAANTNAMVDACDGTGGDVADVIDINPAGCPCTIMLTAGELTVSEALTIHGPGADLLAIDGNGLTRVLRVSGSAGLAMSGVTIQHGFDANGPAGIFLESGAIGDFEAIAVVDNVVGPNNVQVIGINQVPNAALVDAVNDTCIGCDGAGILVNAESTLALTNSLVARNQIIGDGSSGGGIYASFSAITGLVNVTISGNSASDGAGMNVGGSATFNNVTVADNTANAGGGVLVVGTLDLGNTLLSGNLAATGPDCMAAGDGGVINSLNFNLFGSTTDCVITGLGLNDQTDVDPALTPLANNGGPTATMAIAPGSAALDAADNETCQPDDQRTITRPQDGDLVGGAQCDIGAYEYVPPVEPEPTTTVATTTTVAPTTTAASTTTTAAATTVATAPATAVLVEQVLPPTGASDGSRDALVVAVVLCIAGLALHRTTRRNSPA